MIIFLSIYYILLFFFLLTLIIIWLKDQKNESGPLPNFPFVSVLVAVRNEEQNIIRCLDALSELNYPKDKIEVLIGNDRSEDQTRQLVENYIQGKSSFKLIDITSTMGNAKGKANVLAHLAKAAKGEFFFITDADIAVPSTWIHGLLRYHNDSIATISGVTVTEGKNLTAKMQAIEWIFAFGMVQTVSELRIPVSAVGNNMMISRKAYESVGGYETIPFSVTEDFQLFKETLKKGWGYKNICNPEVLAISKPMQDLGLLIKQRKRWMTGAFQLPFILVLCLFIQAIFFPVILLTLFVFPVWGALAWMAKILLQQVFIALVMRRMNTWSGLLKYFIFFEIYSCLFGAFMLVYYILPVKVEWKGRKY